jgi:hypothetical protein
MAWPYAAAEIVWRQDPPWRNLEDGSGRSAPLLISGATTVVRWASRKGAPEGSWLGREESIKLRAGTLTTWSSASSLKRLSRQIAKHRRAEVATASLSDLAQIWQKMAIYGDIQR